MVAKVYNSFAVTISLKDQDFEGEIESWFTSWLSKQDYAFGVVEKDASQKLHAHAQIWNESPSKKGDIFGTAFKSQILKYSPDSVVLGNRGALCSKIAYNDYFIEYQEKDIIKELICKLPQLTDKYYPSEEEQKKVQAEANAVDKEFHKYSVDYESWIQEHPEHEDLFGKDRIRHFFIDKWFVKHEYRMPRRKIDKIQMVENFYLYYFNIKNIKNVMSKEDWESHPTNLKSKINELYPKLLVDL